MPAARKAVAPICHAVARAYDRYGLNIGPSDLSKICRLVQNNQARLDCKNPNGTTTWFLTYNEVPVRAVISPDFYTVRTFLPLDDRQRWKRPKGKRRKIYRGGKASYVGSPS